MLIINHLNGAPPVHGFLLERTSAGTLGIAYDGQKKSHTSPRSQKDHFNHPPKQTHPCLKKNNNKNCLLPQGWIERGWASYGRSFRRAKATSKADIPGMSNTGVCHMSAFNGT